LIHHSWVKPASPEWECIPDPASPSQDHPPEPLCPSCFPGDNRGPQTIGRQPCSSHSGSWLVFTRRKLKHGMRPFSPLHAWTLTFWVGPCKVFPMYQKLSESHCWDLHTAILCIMHPPTCQMLHWLIYSQVNEVAGK
jgi:hypothetical protein